jgi:Flp pilus assembly pilin Flp
LLTLRALWRDEMGAQLVEYVLLTTLIAIICIVGVTALRENLATLYFNAESSI